MPHACCVITESCAVYQICGLCYTISCVSGRERYYLSVGVFDGGRAGEADARVVHLPVHNALAQFGYRFQPEARAVWLLSAQDEETGREVPFCMIHLSSAPSIGGANKPSTRAAARICNPVAHLRAHTHMHKAVQDGAHHGSRAPPGPRMPLGTINGQIAGLKEGTDVR